MGLVVGDADEGRGRRRWCMLMRRREVFGKKGMMMRMDRMGRGRGEQLPEETVVVVVVVGGGAEGEEGGGGRLVVLLCECLRV